MGERDIETLLRNGFWPNSRARSPDLGSSESFQQSSYLSQDDRFVPRRLPWNGRARQNSHHPPPPSVEDESDALAKEVGSVVSSIPTEEPAHRGDPDQYPIILPVHEFNPERRFVLVSNPSDSSSDASGSEGKPTRRRRSAERLTDPEPAFYEANTGRKYGPSPSREHKAGRKKETRPERENRRSRPEDLPPIITDGESEERPHNGRRAKSTTRTDGPAEGYFSPRFSSTSSRPHRESQLTPEVIEHATNGRDRSYYKGGSSLDPEGGDRLAHPTDQYVRNVANERKHQEREPQSAHSTSPKFQKRRTSDVPKYTRHNSKESYESSRHFVDMPPSRPEGQRPASTHSSSERDSASQHSPTTKDKRAPPQHNDTFYSSEDESQPHVNPRRRNQAMPTGKTEYLNTPLESRSSDRQKPRGPSPLPSPRVSQNSVSDPYSSASSARSATFPRELKPPRDEDHGDPTLSRASTARGSFNAARNGIPAAGAATAATITSPSNPSASVDHRRSVAPPLPRVSLTTDSRPLPLTPPASIPAQPTWPPRFEPLQSSLNSDPPISSYRRYSIEVKNGELPDIPHCPRTRAEAGHMDWLTLPRCDNFNICPSCYSNNFSATEFAHHFVPVPFRPQDRPLACDFGTSENYRIAWLFTRKYRKPDLGLFHSLIKIAAQSPPCTGHREVSRIWYSIMDPRIKRPVDEFTVCQACAKTIETLLPSLTGLFVPLDSPAEPTRGVCAMHQDRGHDRGRFLLYFDMLEGAADRALETQSAPNVQALADRIRELAVIPPCPEHHSLRSASWHTMRSIPELTVCRECFFLVVRPLLNDCRPDLTVAGDFNYVPTRLPNGDCMLFSDRMRSVFDRAVRKGDIEYLKAKVRERAYKERECNERLVAIQRQAPGTPWAEVEIERIKKEWKKYE